MLDEPMHVVGQSYGGVSSLMAAARRPEHVRSLTVIEPPAFGLVRRDGAVEEFIRRVERARRDATDPLDYYRRSVSSFGRKVRASHLEPGRRLGADGATFAGAAHSPQLLGAPFNGRLRAFWTSTGS